MMYDGKTRCCFLEVGPNRWAASGPDKSPPPTLCLQEEEAEPRAYICVHFIIWQP